MNYSRFISESESAQASGAPDKGHSPAAGEADTLATALDATLLDLLTSDGAAESGLRKVVAKLRRRFNAEGCAYFWAPLDGARAPLVDGAPPLLSPLDAASWLAEAAEGSENAVLLADLGLWLQPATIPGLPDSRGCLVFRIGSPRAPRVDEAAELRGAGRHVALAAAIISDHRALAEANERFKSLTSSIPGVVYQRVVRPDGDIRYTYISETAKDLFGVSAEEILKNPKALFNSYAREYAESFRRRLIEASKTLSTWDVEASILMPDGSKKYTHAIAKPRRQEDGSVLWTGVILDASRIKEAERRAAEAEARTRLEIVESLGQGVLMFDASDRLMLANSHFASLYPELKDRLQPGAAYSSIVRDEIRQGLGADSSSRVLEARLAERLELHRTQNAFALESQLSEEVWVQINERRTDDGSTVVIHTDISEIRQREERIHHMALHDALTGLPNRVLLRNRIETALAQSRRYGGRVVALCVDLDNFKTVNDTLGHAMGDRLLCLAVERLRGAVREIDTVARMGGDEFAILLPGCDDQEHVEEVAQRIIDSLARPFDLEGQQAAIGASIGVAYGGRETKDPGSLLRDADMALYRAKSDGKGLYRFFAKEMDEEAQARRLLEVELRAAIDTGQMELHFQPQVCVESGEVTGFEALVRWRHPERGLIAPGAFIPAAEETGLIIPLGDWVLENACRAAAKWENPLRVAVNVSPAQFRRRGLVEFVSETLKTSGLPPERLELEITETVLLKSTDDALGILFRLKDLGVRIAMDDFGTGYSSLGNLRSFPFDKIKIDKSFVSDLENNPDASAIVRAVVNLGRSLGIKTTAEGIETLKQLQFVSDEGCSEIQGYLCSAARPEHEIGDFVSGAYARSRRAADAERDRAGEAVIEEKA